MSRIGHKNCWEYWNCPEEVHSNCPAFKLNSGDKCWSVAGNFVNKLANCPKLKNKYEFCWQCEWFKCQNPEFIKSE